eukprot:scaffold102337_cov37-Cyclotella_meneghiniana.AAC.1
MTRLEVAMALVLKGGGGGCGHVVSAMVGGDKADSYDSAQRTRSAQSPSKVRSKSVQFERTLSGLLSGL